jgi:Xaa-Pro aminopeptidase
MSAYPDRLAALRAELAARDLDGFVVPLTDEHMSEYVGAYAQRLGWLTGFGGSAGTAVVLADKAAIFTDGRYTLQVREQVDGADWDYVQVPETSIADWVVANVGHGDVIGYDPWLHTASWARTTHDRLQGEHGAILAAVTRNPIDVIWADRPAPSPAPLSVYDDPVAGRSSAEKRALIGDWLREHGADAVVLTSLDSIAWTLNIRGGDVAHTPVPLSYAVVNADGTTDLFVAPEKVDDRVRQHLGNAVRLHDRSAFQARYFRSLAGKRVALDPERSVSAIDDLLTAADATIVSARDPVVLMKAIKHPAEIAGHRAASIRDGAALTRFLRWAAETLPEGGETELSAAARLHGFRQETGRLRDLSFDTISATGLHGAIPHYRVTEASSLPIKPGQLFLIDSGAQYSDGTTDVTRVVPVGEPTAEQRDRFTRVLQGHIAIATAVFPDGTQGAQIDAFARRPLWNAGLDFGHGTGHGVGSFLSVHEGPQRIAPPSYPGGQSLEPLRAGMMLSNEPGYYKPGEYGIRIENLVLIEPRVIAGGDPDRAMLGFETLTWAPIERELIAVRLLTAEERSWVDSYHAQVLAKLGPELDEDTRAWLATKCAPLDP